MRRRCAPPRAYRDGGPRSPVNLAQRLVDRITVRVCGARSRACRRFEAEGTCHPWCRGLPRDAVSELRMRDAAIRRAQASTSSSGQSRPARQGAQGDRDYTVGMPCAAGGSRRLVPASAPRRTVNGICRARRPRGSSKTTGCRIEPRRTARSRIVIPSSLTRCRGSLLWVDVTTSRRGPRRKADVRDTANVIYSGTTPNAATSPARPGLGDQTAASSQ